MELERLKIILQPTGLYQWTFQKTTNAHKLWKVSHRVPLILTDKDK